MPCNHVRKYTRSHSKHHAIYHHRQLAFFPLSDIIYRAHPFICGEQQRIGDIVETKPHEDRQKIVGESGDELLQTWRILRARGKSSLASFLAQEGGV